MATKLSHDKILGPNFHFLFFSFQMANESYWKLTSQIWLKNEFLPCGSNKLIFGENFENRMINKISKNCKPSVDFRGERSDFLFEPMSQSSMSHFYFVGTQSTELNVEWYQKRRKRKNLTDKKIWQYESSLESFSKNPFGENDFEEDHSVRFQCHQASSSFHCPSYSPLKSIKYFIAW